MKQLNTSHRPIDMACRNCGKPTKANDGPGMGEEIYYCPTCVVIEREKASHRLEGER